MTYDELTYRMRSASSQASAQEQLAAYARMQQAQAQFQQPIDFDQIAFRQQQGRVHKARPLPIQQPAPNHWSLVLAVQPNASVAEIKDAYRKMAKLAHPDNGGSKDAFNRLSAAKDQALRERGSK